MSPGDAAGTARPIPAGSGLRRVALLRGVNVGGKNRVAMAELRLVFESLGGTGVATFIQSGNVVFSTESEMALSAVQLQEAVRERFGIEVSVVLRTGPEMEAVVEHNPFPDADPATLHVGFMAADPDPAVLGSLDGRAFSPEAFAVHGKELYLFLPDGMARTKLPGYLDRRLKVPTTFRNWSTVTKLVALVNT